MDVDRFLSSSSLERFEKGGAPVLTLYLNTTWDESGKNKDRLRIFLKNKVRDAQSLMEFEPDDDYRQSFDRDVEKIQSQLETLSPDVNGLAIFASDGLGIFESFELPHAVENEFDVSNRPYLRQIVSWQTSHRPVLVCQADGRSGRYLEVIDGEITREKLIEKEEPERESSGRLDKQRGDGQKLEADAQFGRTLAENLHRIANKHDFRQIVLLGQQRMLGEITRELAKGTAERIIDREPIDPNASDDAILKLIEAAQKKAEAEAEASLVEQVTTLGLGSGPGAVGVPAVLAALRKGAVRTLVMEPDFRQKGFRTKGTNALFVEEEEARSYDGGGVEEVELGEATLFEAFRQGADVEMLQLNESMMEGGVGALLRY